MASIKGGKNLSKELQRLAGKIGKGRAVQVGFFENAKYPDGTPVAMVAAIQDFGAPRAGIPPRPFFRNMIARHKGEWPKAIAQLLKDNEFDAELTLKQVGEAVAGQLRQSIQDTNEPPLKPATVRRKGFSKPLIDTAHMLDSVGYKVKE